MGRILVLAGVNGAGKSSLLGMWLEEEGLTWFNPDTFTRRLVETGWALGEANAAAWNEGARRLRQLHDASMGFDPQQIAFVKANGLIATARIANPLNLTPARLNQTFDDIEQTGARVVIFADDEVLGYDSLLSSVAREMRKRGLIFTNIEFSKQRGSRDFAMNTEGELVRLHTVTGDEAARADAGAGLEGRSAEVRLPLKADLTPGHYAVMWRDRPPIRTPSPGFTAFSTRPATRC